MARLAPFARSSSFALLVLVGTFSAPPAVAAGRGGPSLAQLLPKETLLYVSADARALDAGLRSLGVAGLLRDEEMQTFLAPLLESLGLAGAPDPLGAVVDSLALSEWVRGEAGFGFVGVSLVPHSGEPLRISGAEPVTARLLHALVTGPDGGSPLSSVSFDFLLSVEPGPALRALVEGALDEPPPGVEVGSIQMNGQAVTAVIVPLGDALSTTIYADTSGDRWWISGDHARLSAAMTGGSNTSLEDSPAWRAFSSRLKTGGNVAFCFANVAKALGAVRNLVPPIVLEEAALLGLDGLTGAGVGVSMSDGGVRESVLLAFDGDPQGVLSLLDAFGGGFPSLADAPADTTAFVGLRFDASTLLARVESLLSRVAPRVDPAFLQEARIEGPGGLDVVKDVLPALGSELAVTVSPPSNAMLPNVVLSVEIRDAEKFARLLDAAKEFAARESGAELNPLPLKSGEEGFVLQIEGAPVQPAFVVRGDRLYGAISPISLKTHVARHLDAADRATLGREDGALPRVIDALTGGRSDLPTLLVAVDLERAIPYLYETLAPFLSSALAESGTGLDAALLPLPETLQPHLSGVALALSRGDDGLSIDVFSPTGLLPLALAALAAEQSRSEEVVVRPARVSEVRAAPESH